MQNAIAKSAAVGLLVVCFLILSAPNAGAGTEIWGVKPEAYPEIGNQELGHFRWSLSLADQELTDFRNLEASDQRMLSSYRYSIAFMTYFLALEQYHKVPAWTEAIQPRMDRLIQKMLTKPVWEFWAEVSRGLRMIEPKLNLPYPSEHDPVAHRNIMYSGHLAHMIGLYEMLYRDLKWDKPGSIVFAWNEKEKYVYDNYSLQKVMYDQFMNLPDHCVECEPNACFPECNQHPILSFMLYDYLHKTNFSQAQKPFMEFFLREKMIDPQTHEAAAFYLVKQKFTVSQKNPRFGNALSYTLVPSVALGLVSVDASSANGWTGVTMHPWQPEYIERHYPYQLQRHWVEIDRNKARLKKDTFYDNISHGFFAMLMSEMGDTENLKKLLNWCDANYKPVWEQGMFHYPIHADQYVRLNPTKNKKSIALTDKLLACARANVKNGFWLMHNRPYDETHFTEPAVSGVDFPRLILRRAIYDRERQALVVTTEPGTKNAGASAFNIMRLDPAKTWRLAIDGKEIASYQGKSSISVEAPLNGRHDIILAAR